MVSSNGAGADPEIRDAIRRSVADVPDIGSSLQPPSGGWGEGWVMWVGTIADAILPWGAQPKARDAQLRTFFPSENYLMSGLGTVAGRNAAFSWKLEGSDRLVEMAKQMILNAQQGQGWLNFVVRHSLDLYSQDSGAFTEIIRAGDSPTAPVVNFAQRDAARCYPTGDPKTPIIYRDRLGRFHALKWYQIYQHLESPSPVENFQGPLYGLQYSAVSRVLKAAQILKSITTYQDEKISGRNESAIHLIRGIDVKKIEDAMAQSRSFADAAGNTRYLRPAMVGSHNPEAEVGHDTIELASLPTGFDLETQMKWYISAMALALNVDYQDLAPLPSGNLGSGQQSEVLHMKSRGKGPALWQKGIEHFINNSGVLPEGVSFMFDEQDMSAEQEEVAMKLQRATQRSTMITSTEIDAAAARQMALDAGDITQEIYDDLEKRAAEEKAKTEAAAVQQQGMAQEAHQTNIAVQQAKIGDPAAAGGDIGDAQAQDNKPQTQNKERVPPGRRELEDAVTDPIEAILTGVNRTLTNKIRSLGIDIEAEDEKAYKARKRGSKTLRTVTATDGKGRAMQVLEEAV